MVCSSFAGRKEVSGVEKVEVSLEERKAVVFGEMSVCSLEKGMAESGKEGRLIAVDEEVVLDVEGMRCGGCVKRITEVLSVSGCP